MLFVNDPDKTVLKKVEPKNSPAANSNQRVGCTFSQSPRAGNSFDGHLFEAAVSSEIQGKEPLNARPVMAHSKDQSTAITAANNRSKATFGTSTLEISASEMTYSLPRNISGTRKTANSHRPSSPRLIQGRNDAPCLVAKLCAVGVEVRVVTLSV